MKLTVTIHDEFVGDMEIEVEIEGHNISYDEDDAAARLKTENGLVPKHIDEDITEKAIDMYENCPDIQEQRRQAKKDFSEDQAFEAQRENSLLRDRIW